MSVEHSVLAENGDVGEAVAVPAGGRRLREHLVVTDPAESHVPVRAIPHVHRSRAHGYCLETFRENVINLRESLG